MYLGAREVSFKAIKECSLAGRAWLLWASRASAVVVEMREAKWVVISLDAEMPTKLRFRWVTVH